MAVTTFTREDLPIQTRLSLLGKKQTDLLDKVRENGYPKVDQATLSKYIRGRVITPQAQAVLEMCRKFLKEWESKVEAKEGE